MNEASILGVDVVNRSLVSIRQKIKDQVLVNFFKALCEIKRIPQPDLPDKLIRKAIAIRNWMKDNAALLAEIRVLSLRKSNLSSVPVEINLFTNLQCLVLDDNPITALPEGFNPPNLESLYLSNTRITALPPGFNPPNFRWSTLDNTPLERHKNLRLCKQLLRDRDPNFFTGIGLIVAGIAVAVFQRIPQRYFDLNFPN